MLCTYGIKILGTAKLLLCDPFRTTATDMRLITVIDLPDRLYELVRQEQPNN